MPTPKPSRPPAKPPARPPMADADFKTELSVVIPHMRAFARSLCKHPADAEDLAQEALAKAWAARRSYEAGTNLKAWTFMIIRNQFYSDKRRSWRQQSLDPEVAANTLTATTNPTAALELDEVRRALALLPEEQREALILIGVAGLSYEEAAAICDAAIGTIKSRVSRARDKLATLVFDGAFGEDDTRPDAAMETIIAAAAALAARAA
jgi:RNA polymerase sigma-70 factor (ECF subfamily)